MFELAAALFVAWIAISAVCGVIDGLREQLSGPLITTPCDPVREALDAEAQWQRALAADDY